MEISGIRSLAFAEKTSQDEVGIKYESLFLSLLLKEMKVPKLQDDTLEPILRMEISDSICRACNLGIRDFLTVIPTKLTTRIQ